MSHLSRKIRKNLFAAASARESARESALAWPRAARPCRQRFRSPHLLPGPSVPDAPRCDVLGVMLKFSECLRTDEYNIKYNCRPTSTLCASVSCVQYTGRLGVGFSVRWPLNRGVRLTCHITRLTYVAFSSIVRERLSPFGDASSQTHNAASTRLRDRADRGRRQLMRARWCCAVR